MSRKRLMYIATLPPIQVGDFAMVVAWVAGVGRLAMVITYLPHVGRASKKAHPRALRYICLKARAVVGLIDSRSRKKIAELIA